LKEIKLLGVRNIWRLMGIFIIRDLEIPEVFLVYPTPRLPRGGNSDEFLLKCCHF
jgi:hypothetical protein